MNKPPSQEVSVSAELIERYSKITSGTLTTELFEEACANASSSGYGR